MERSKVFVFGGLGKISKRLWRAYRYGHFTVDTGIAFGVRSTSFCRFSRSIKLFTNTRSPLYAVGLFPTMYLVRPCRVQKEEREPRNCQFSVEHE